MSAFTASTASIDVYPNTAEGADQAERRIADLRRNGYQCVLYQVAGNVIWQRLPDAGPPVSDLGSNRLLVVSVKA